jgi:hypothetical protein
LLVTITIIMAITTIPYILGIGYTSIIGSILLIVIILTWLFMIIAYVFIIVTILIMLICLIITLILIKCRMYLILRVLLGRWINDILVLLFQFSHGCVTRIIAICITIVGMIILYWFLTCYFLFIFSVY